MMYKALFFLMLLIAAPPTYAQAPKENFNINMALSAAANPWLGQVGLRDALARGLIRKADPDDLKQYLYAQARAWGLPDHVINNHYNFDGEINRWSLDGPIYVVISPDFIIPSWIDRKAAFIVPEGLPEIQGSEEHGRVYRYDAHRLQSREPLAETCRFPASAKKWPAEARVLAVGSWFAGPLRSLDLRIEPGTRRTQLNKIIVNSPSEPVLLMLQSPEPSLWHISWTEGTKIAGLFIGGDYKQIVSGLPTDVPVLISNQSEHPVCPSFTVSSQLASLVSVNHLSRHLFHKDVHQLYPDIPAGGALVLGQALMEDSRVESAEELDPGKYAMPPDPWSGPAGLRRALVQGLIRPATQEDYQRYQGLLAEYSGLSDEVKKDWRGGFFFYPDWSYVVLSPDFVIPDGLYDGQAIVAQFIVPEGLPEPKGPRRGIEIVNLDRLKSASQDKKPIAEACRFSSPFRPSPGARVYAVDAGFGSALDFQLDWNAVRGRLTEVTVNSPAEPVFLMLETSKPTIWHFRWTRDTQILGVVISGEGKQIVSGLPENISLLVSNPKDRLSACPDFDLSGYSGQTALTMANDLSLHLFNQEIAKIYHAGSQADDSTVLIGPPPVEDSSLESAEELDVNQYRAPGTPLVGQAGFYEALEKGLIRVASADDIRAFKVAEAKAMGLPDSLIENNLDLKDDSYRNAYLVLSPDFIIPAEAGWGRHVSLYVPEGLPEPKGACQAAGCYVYSYGPRPPESPLNEACRFADRPSGPPAKARVYAAGPKRSYGWGTGLDFYIDEHSQGWPRLMKTTVNSPAEPVILMLETYGSTIWHFSWTKGSKIAAVYIDGPGRQAVSGLPADVPVLINQRGPNGDGPRLCPGFGASSHLSGLVKANDLSRHLFKRDIYQVLELDEAQELLIGRALRPDSRLESAEELNLVKFKVSRRTKAGPAALEDALANGLIRKARPDEIQDYLKARAKAEGLPDHIVKGGFNSDGYAVYLNPYVLLSPDFSIPKGLDDDQSASFIVPPGLRPPQWPPFAAKAPLRLPEKYNGRYQERVASRIYSYDDLKSFPIGLYHVAEQEYLSRGRNQPVVCYFPFGPEVFPAEARVYAAGVDSGPELDFSLSGSLEPARLARVTVNSPEQPALLILRAESPTIWHFNWTRGTTIAGVYLGGKGPQRASGLPAGMPVLSGDQLSARDCRPVELSSSLVDLIAVNNLSRLLYDKNIELVHLVKGNEITVGPPLSADGRLEKAEKFNGDRFKDPGTLPSGPDGLRAAVAKDLIRKASPMDIEAYAAAKSRAQVKAQAEYEDLPEHLILQMGYGRLETFDMPNPYVVLSPDFIIPAQLSGPDSASFIVPKGLPEPKGPPGDCHIYSYGRLEKEAEGWASNWGRHSRPPKWKSPFADTCRLPASAAASKIYAVAGPSGSKLDFQIDDSGEPAYLKKITLNAPSESVALFLGADRPTIWHFSWTPGSRISALLFSENRYRQIVSGLPEDIPILYGQGDGYDFRLCPPKFAVSSRLREMKVVNDLSRHLFKKDIDELKYIRDDQVIGRPLDENSRLESAEELDLNKYFDPNKSLAGESGLKKAISDGLIRRATQEDIDQYLAARNKAGGLKDEAAREVKRRDLSAMEGEGNCHRNYAWGSGKITEPHLLDEYHSYVVLSPDFVIPPGLAFPHFIVPAGFPAPQGLLNCGEIFRYDDLLPMAE